MKRNSYYKEKFEKVNSFNDIVDGDEYLVNYNGTEFKSKLHKEGDAFACKDSEHGMRIKFKEQNMTLGHISLKSIQRKEYTEHDD